MPDSRNVRPILEMRGISKRFPGVVALDKVDFSLNPGEIQALIGQNGAGKSTLMKILAGDYLASEGHIILEDGPVIFHHPREALNHGIAIVYQELSLLPNLSVADNIFLGREMGWLFVISEAQILAEARQMLDLLGDHHIDVNQKVERLSLAQQQLVEIAKALSYKPRILILDEPTATLTQEDASRLFEILKRLKSQGIGIIYISHRLKEIMAHCDRGTVLRNGKLIDTVEVRRTTEEALIELMIGQKKESFYRGDGRAQPLAGDVLLEVGQLSIGDEVRDVSFVLRRGEILGITGLLGAGQNELARALFGVQPGVSGTIRRNGQSVTIGSPQAAIALGICLVTENRKEEGLFADMSVKENISIASLSKFLLSRGFPWLRNVLERQAVQTFINKVNVVLRSADAKIRTLSGGNQQKAILARWLLKDLEILIFIEPTRGIDVGAKAEIYRHLDTLAKEGRGIIVISPELAEILGVADRIFVMRNGRLVLQVGRSEATEELLLAAIQGALFNSKESENSNGNLSANTELAATAG